MAVRARQYDELPFDAVRKYRVVLAEGRGVAWPMNHTFNGKRAVPVVSVGAARGPELGFAKE